MHATKIPGKTDMQRIHKYYLLFSFLLIISTFLTTYAIADSGAVYIQRPTPPTAGVNDPVLPFRYVQPPSLAIAADPKLFISTMPTLDLPINNTLSNDNSKATTDAVFPIFVKCTSSIPEVIKALSSYKIDIEEIENREVSLCITNPPDLYSIGCDRMEFEFKNDLLSCVNVYFTDSAVSEETLRLILLNNWGKPATEDTWLGKNSCGYLYFLDENEIELKLVYLALPSELNNKSDSIDEKSEPEEQKPVTEVEPDISAPADESADNNISNPDPLFKNVQNGFIKEQKLLQENDYTAPFAVNAPPDESCYVYLQDPLDGNKDCSIFVEKGTTCEVEVLLGKYVFYYASGENWISLPEKFGEDTRHYRASEMLTFYEDEDGFVGHTITLEKIEGGNFETFMIDPEDFPE